MNIYTVFWFSFFFSCWFKLNTKVAWCQGLYLNLKMASITKSLTKSRRGCKCGGKSGVGSKIKADFTVGCRQPTIDSSFLMHGIGLLQRRTDLVHVWRMRASWKTNEESFWSSPSSFTAMWPKSIGSLNETRRHSKASIWSLHFSCHTDLE